MPTRTQSVLNLPIQRMMQAQRFMARCCFQFTLARIGNRTPLRSSKAGPNTIERRATPWKGHQPLTFRATPERSADRLFSNLDNSLRHQPGNTLGAATLVAGTAVGAGILALPVACSSEGFIAASTAITLAAIFSILTALCVAEVAVNTMCELGTGSGVSLGSMAERTLGETGANTVKLTYLLLHYTLLVAYISKAGETLHNISGIDNSLLWDAAFTGVIGILCYATSSSALDKVNRVLVSGVLGAFFSLLFLVIQTVNIDNLIRAEWTEVPKALPIIALSFVFQNVVPYVCSTLEGDISKIRSAIIGGVSVPWLMFLLWTGAILGNASGNTDMDPLAAVRELSNTGGLLIDTFSLLAICTSFIGFVLGLTEFLEETLRLFPRGKGKIMTFPLTLLPPLAFAIAYPNLFLDALNFAGTYGVLILFGVIPVAMVWSERYDDVTVSSVNIMPSGRLGKPILVSVGMAASGIIIDQALSSFLTH